MNGIKIVFSECHPDIAEIHDALYSYNLSKTGRARENVQAEHFPEHAALLACDETGHRLGGIAYHWKNDPRQIFVDYFFLEESIRGRGVGAMLFQELFRLAKAQGAREINLTTNTFQSPVFYKKLGFLVTLEKKKPQPNCPENIHYYLRKEIQGP